jgi:hypothetical protein
MASAAAISAATAAATVPFPRPVTWLPIHHICGKIITPKGLFFSRGHTIAIKANRKRMRKRIRNRRRNYSTEACAARAVLHGKITRCERAPGVGGGGAGADGHAGNSRPSCAIRINWGLGLNMNGLIDLLFHPRCICLLPMWRWWTLEFATE